MQTTQPLSARPAVAIERARLGLPLLAATMLLVAAVFVAIRATSVSDGVAGAYVTSSWSAAGLAVEPLPGVETSLRSGDVVTSVAGRPLGGWFATLLDPARARPSMSSGASVEYAVTRDGDALAVPVRLAPYPLGGVLLENWSTLLWAASLAAVGSYLYWRRPHEPATRALLLLGTGVLASSVPWMMGIGPSDIMAGGPSPLLYLVATFAIYGLFWSAALHFALVFPQPIADQQVQQRLVLLAYLVPLSAQGAWMIGTLPGSPNALAWIGGWTLVQLAVVPAVLLATMATVLLQWRRAGRGDRLRMRGILWAGLAAAVGILAGWFLPQLLTGRPMLPWSAVGLVGLAFPVSLAFAVSRHGLFGVETLLHRSLVYGGLTVGVILAYAGSVVLLGAILPGDGPYAVTLLATGVAALVALPLRDRLQRAVSHLLYGDRDEPHRAMARLGERLEASLEPGTILPMVAGTVAEALRLPYVAIELGTDGSRTVAAAHGTPRGELERLPLVHHGEEIGWLALAERGPDQPFSSRDRALLGELARQAGAAAYAVRLTAELQRSRQQIVSAREEERRRLRRDLHDELGPALAGSLMKIEAARASAPEDAALAGLLSDLAEQTRRTIDEIRRVASDLRPPALDQLGLVGALEQEAKRLCPRGCTFRIDAPDRLPGLPAAVEVAAYRIGLEALTNVAHHADARRAWLELQLVGDALRVEVRDDGRGLDELPRAGIGLTSMSERAEELGGEVEIGRADEGGLRVRARLPLGSLAGHA